MRTDTPLNFYRHTIFFSNQEENFQEIENNVLKN